MVPARPFFIGRPGWVRSSAWIWRLLVDRQHDGVGRRVDIEPDDVAELGGERRVVGELERRHPVRLQAVGRQIRCTERDADADRLGHRARRSSGSPRPAARPAVSATTRVDHCPGRAAACRAAGSCRAAARRRPACMKRSCQRQTPVLHLPGPPHDLRSCPARRRSAARSAPARRASAGCSDEV